MTEAEKQRKSDAEHLLAQPQFKRFLFRLIHLAGLFDHTHRATSGSDGRDLAFAEGRRSLGFDILREADAGQSMALQDAQALLTLVSVVTAEIQSRPKEKTRGRDRADDDRDDDGSDDD